MYRGTTKDVNPAQAQETVEAFNPEVFSAAINLTESKNITNILFQNNFTDILK